MKKLIKSLIAISVLVPFIGANAATYNVGTFYVAPENPDGDYSIDASGVFWDEFDFSTYTFNWRDRPSMTFSGTHDGMYNDELLLINMDTRQTYSLDEDFSVTVDNIRYGRFAITGSGLTATDPTIVSSYNLTMEAAVTNSPYPPNPVPLPAAAWLFVSGLTGIVAFRRGKKFI